MDEDPWYWDVDRVVRELCTPERSWTPRFSSESMPNAAELEEKLRENELEGVGLLTSLDQEGMRELGARSLKQRQSLSHVIAELRIRSARYHTFVGQVPQSFLPPSNQHGALPVNRKRSAEPPQEEDQLQNKKPRLDAEDERPVPPAAISVPAHMNGVEVSEDAPAEQHSLNDALIMDQAHREQATTAQKVKQPKRIAPTFIRSISPTRLQKFEASKEQDLVDNGDKNPIDGTIAHSPGDAQAIQEPIASEIEGLHAVEEPVLQEIEVSHDSENTSSQNTAKVQPGTTFVDEAGRKRIVPVLQAVISSGTREKIQQEPDASGDLAANTESRVVSRNDFLARGYLGREKMPVDTIFYGKGLVGLEEGDEDKPADFEFHGQEISAGRRLYVSSVMKRFLRQNNLDRVPRFSRNGKSYSAIIPYPAQLVPQNKDRYFTLLHTSGDGEVHATKETVTNWPELVIDDENRPATKAAHSGPHDERNMANGFPSFADFNIDYDAIQAKYANLPGGDTELPAFGDSGSEGEYDYETWKEMEDEMMASTKGKLKKIKIRLRGISLKPEEVLSAIDEGIAELVSNWHTRKLPKLESRAWLLFKRYQRLGNKARRHRRDILKGEITHLNEVRIPKQRTEIAKEVWTRVEQVRKQVKGSMEVSVFDRERKLWELNILKSKIRPPKPAQQPTKAKKETSSAGLADGEELIGNVSGSESEDDLGDFIDDDDEMGELTAGPSDDDSGDSSEAEEETSNNITKSTAKIAAPASEPPVSPRVLDRLLVDGVASAELQEDELELPPHRPSSSKPRASRRPVSRSNIVDLTISSDSHGDDLPRTPRSSGEHSSVAPSMLPPQHSGETIDLLTPRKPPSKGGSIDLVTPGKERTFILKANGKSSVITISSDSDSKHSPVSKTPLPRPEEIPAHHEIAKIAALSYDVLMRLEDRKRLLIKFLYQLKPQELRDGLLAEFEHAEESNMWTTFQDVIQAMHFNQEVTNMESSTFNTYVIIIRMFRMYVECRNQPAFRKRDGKYSEITKKLVDELEAQRTRFSELCKLVLDFAKTLREYDEDDEMPVARRTARLSPYQNGSGGATGESGLSDGERSPTEDLVSAKRGRKRKLVENKEARELRESNKERIEQQRIRRLELQDKLASQGMSTADDTARIIINEGKLDDEGFVYINETIGQRIKPHQISGVRFMWEQIVTDTKNMQGCLLAHTMGLGKTMQVITLLVAIAEAAASEDESVSKQIPPGLRFSRTLVLCPPGLVDNWEDELLTWAPQHTIGDPFKVSSNTKLEKRLEIVQDWYDAGGVLILGYQMFRILLSNTAVKNKGAPLSDEEHRILQGQLLEGPNIIIADEAHKLKNASAKISVATSQFRSQSRIALTGSPLNNNVEEYHSMIDWVAPNYLGPIKEFRTKYKEPIEAGLWVDSDPYSRRRSKKMLAVLISELELKVNRANMSVLRNDLPPKKEFVIRVALTSLQREAYLIYVRHMRSASALDLVPVSKDGHLSQATLWSWLADLSLLCNHPSNFKKKIAAIGKRPNAVENSAPSFDDDDDEGSGNQEAQVASQDAIIKTGTKEEIMAILNNVEDIEAPELSNKMLLFDKILDQCKAVRDKVLVFSQSIPTLDYLEVACKNRKREYLRLDGNTRMSKRQTMTKDFNTGRCEVFLISTGAGGLGLNLFAANRVIIFDFKYNPTQEEQAIGRAYRIGQVKPVFVYRLVASGTFETKVENKAVYKMQLASRVVDKENPVAWAKKSVAEYLADPEDMEQENLTGFLGEDVVLDNVLNDHGTKSIVRSILKTDTFAEADEDDLTAEDKREVEQMREDAKLMRTDPQKYAVIIRKRQTDDAAKAQQKELTRQYNEIKASQAATKAAAARTAESQERARAMHTANTPAQQKPTPAASQAKGQSATSNTPAQQKPTPAASQAKGQSATSNTPVQQKSTPAASQAQGQSATSNTPAQQKPMPAVSQTQSVTSNTPGQQKPTPAITQTEGVETHATPRSAAPGSNGPVVSVTQKQASRTPLNLTNELPSRETPKPGPQPITRAPSVQSAPEKSSETSTANATVQQPASSNTKTDTQEPISAVDGTTDAGNKKEGFLKTIGRTMSRLAGSKD